MITIKMRLTQKIYKNCWKFFENRINTKLLIGKRNISSKTALADRKIQNWLEMID